MRFTEGVAACKAFAFNDPQLPRLCTNMATVHTASAHVAEKIGMK
ncbi:MULTISPECIES: GNAT family N-acetyltransferase [Brevibacillus]|jgi:RimJ/RimL family protein N-acetyltransferase